MESRYTAVMAECDPPEPPPLLRPSGSRQLSMHERIKKQEREVEARREFFGDAGGGGCLVPIVCFIAAGAGLARAIL